MNCNNACKICRNLVISDSVSVVTVDGTDTLVIDIPEGIYANCRKVCLVIAQTIPSTATILMPVAISIGSDVTTVYPVLNCDGSDIYASSIRTRVRYPLRIVTSNSSAIFKSLTHIDCYPTSNLQYIPSNGVGG